VTTIANSLDRYLRELPKFVRQAQDDVTAVPIREQDVEALIQQARIDAASQERRRCEEEMRTRLVEAERSADERINLARATWARAIGQELAESLRAALGQIEACVAEAVETALETIIEQREREAIREAFTAAVRDVLRERSAVQMSLEGPEECLEQIASAIRETGVYVDAVCSDRADIVGKVDDTLVRARLNSIMDRLNHGE
jgi:hypothetical protein